MKDGSRAADAPPSNASAAQRPSARPRGGATSRGPGQTRFAASPGARTDPLWYRDAIIYEVHVRAFRDGNGDGTGDFRGLIEKLDYLRDLGVTALWLLPFYPSPLRDDGYDIADYVDVHPDYGTLRDAETFIREAHRRGLRVITELVCNHTSDQHPWFQRARRAKPGSPWRDWYVWSDTTDRYPDARIIFKDFEASNWTWDAVAGAYYWHRFYSHQPDLNFDNPHVRAAITRAMDFWLDRGVDGLRLDAVPYLFERDGTDCENLPETHEFLRELRRHVDGRYGDRMLLAEANQWPEDAAAYFGRGDECHMAFNFPVMPRLFMSIRMEDRRPIVDIVEQTPVIPADAQWALFLRNHDELTLEMVTDEERDYMYRVYAAGPRERVNLGIRRRLAPLLGNHRRRIELMNGLLFSLPGTPVIYYGDEIGMGDNVYLGDRDSVRTPMQWSGDRNAGFSTANREDLYLPVVSDPENQYEAVNVALQQANPHSLLWWTKRLIALRKRHAAFGRGDLELLHPENRRILAFLRRLGDETVLVVANLSRFFQPVTLDLARYAGRQPIEMFGRIEFPTIGVGPYPLSLGPHEFLWFTIERPGHPDGQDLADALPALPVAGLDDLMDGGSDAALTSILLRWIRGRNWYRGGGRRINEGEIVDRVALGTGAFAAALIVLRVKYSEGEPDTYLIPVAIAASVDGSLRVGDGISRAAEPPGMRIAGLGRDDDRPADRFLVDATRDPGFTSALIDTIARRRRLRGSQVEFLGRPGPSLRGARETTPGSSKASAAATQRWNLQLRHVLEPGPDPESEVIQFLTAGGATWIPGVAGELAFRFGSGECGSAALVREAVARDGDLAEPTRQALLSFLELAAAMPIPAETPSLATEDLVRAGRDEPPEIANELLGSYMETARSIGRRVAELHLALASATDDPSLSPERFTRLYQRSLYQSINSLATQVLRALSGESTRLDGSGAADAGRVQDLMPELTDRLRALLRRRFGGERIRVHGALRLELVSHTDGNAVAIDLESDANRPSDERRLKRSPLCDVASMIRSFHELALGRLREADVGGALRPEDAPALDVWARQWCLWISAAFTGAYRRAAGNASFLPAEEDELIELLDLFRLQAALEDLDAALRHDRDRVPSSIRGLLEILDL